MFADAGSALDELAREGSATGIAQYLGALRVRGERNHACECPVAVWLRLCTGFQYVVDEYGVRETSECEDDDSSICGIPIAVRDFIIRFDNGLFPELEIA